ncbi:(Fe-S)-binding protein [Tistrella bauzanensis]|uniref:(Fe-S)-binding protein n=1 Tax=Tistrella TaxID=171436 RepID=UPI0031F717A5
MSADVEDKAGLPPRALQPVTVGLFATCLVDMFRPSVGFATARLLEAAGCRVVVPDAQTCCGQPAYNSGDSKDARALARDMIRLFEPFDYVVVPSGSCGGMISHHYPDLLRDDPDWGPRARRLAARCYELMAFLVDVRGMDAVSVRLDATVTYHDSCSGLRELGVKAQPRRLLDSVEGLTLKELTGAEDCCGFGGTFCVKYPDISGRMVSNKVADIRATGADMLLAGDMGCLLNMAGRLKREGSTVQVRHVAEVLAGMTDTAPIGDTADAARRR